MELKNLALRGAAAALALAPMLVLAQSNCGLAGQPPCPVPEPGSLWLVGLALGAAGAVSRYLRKK